MAELIGNCSCPLCGNNKARVKLSKAQLAVLTCNSCNCQLFARSDRSDELVRKLIKIEQPPAPPAAKPDDEPAPKPAKEKPADKTREKVAGGDWGI